MAERYTRRINLYINGKEVRNNISSIRKEMNRLQNEQARMTVGSRAYQMQAERIKSLKTKGHAMQIILLCRRDADDVFQCKNSG